MAKTKPKYYGIYNSVQKKYQFGIVATNPRKAGEMLEEEIGKGSYQYRFQVKGIGHTHPYVKHAVRTKQVPNFYEEDK